MPALIARASRSLQGIARVPGDKSLSHRALMFGAMAIGETVISGLLEGEDVLRTAAALRLMGVTIRRDDDGRWFVQGVGVGGLSEPADVLDMGNSGTSTRLLAGLVTPYGFTTFFTGDASLRKRPMKRIEEPLSLIGARFLTRSGGRLPMALTGTAMPIPIEYTLPVASAQVKSAILLAGLNTAGRMTVIEHEATRNHTENMLRHFGASVTEDVTPQGTVISVEGYPVLRAAPVVVPADPSSAAFPAVAAAIVPDSRITIPGVCLNATRTGFIETLLEMGANIVIANRRVEGGEEIGDLDVSTSALSAVDVPAHRAPRQIDEYPVLAMAAACATGTTRFRGLHELRVKESDRLAVVAEGLQQCGVTVQIEGDDLLVTGTGHPPTGGATIATHLDHRIAMSFLVLGLVSREPVAIDDGEAINTSFPGFVGLINGMGGKIEG